MTASDYPMHQLTDDMLVAFAQVDAGIPVAGEGTAGLVALRVSELAGPAVSAYVAAHPSHRKGAHAVSEILADAVAGYAGAQFNLSARLLQWASATTGMPASEIVAAVLEMGVDA